MITQVSTQQRMSGTRSSTSSVETLKQLKSISRASSPLVDEVTASTLGNSSSTSSDGILTPIAGECSSNRSASQIREGSFQEPASSEVRRHNSRESEGFLRLRIGDIVSHSHGLNQVLRIHVPGLHVELQLDDQLALGNQPNANPLLSQQPNHQPLLLEFHCLSSSGNEVHNDLHFVDLDGGDWVERSTPEGVLFSPGGLLLKRMSTLLRLRIR